MQKRRHEKPIARTNPSGKDVWVARWTNRHGQRKSAGTFKLKGPCRAPVAEGVCCAQHRIDFMYDQDSAAVRRPDTVGAYVETWTQRHPRSERTNKTNVHRIGRVLDVEVEGRRLRDWPLSDLRRRHATDILDELLRVQKRAAEGAQGILRALSAMCEDALNDELCEVNPFKGVRVRANDPRIVKAPKTTRVCSWEEMHGFARAAAAARTSKAKPRRVPIYGEPEPVEVIRRVPVYEEWVVDVDRVVPGQREEIAPGVQRFPVERVDHGGMARVKVGTRDVPTVVMKRPVLGYREIAPEPAAMDLWRPVYAEAMVRSLSDAGVRLGEVLPLQRQDLRPAGACPETIATKDRGVVPCPVTVPHLHVRRTAHEGSTLLGTKTTHGTPEGGRAVPLAPELERLLRGLPPRIDTPLLFPTPTGGLWRERNWYRDVWDPARKDCGLEATPHAFRHSWISLLQAAGVDHADLAEMAGHTVETMHQRYSHSLGRSFETAAKAVGA